MPRGIAAISSPASSAIAAAIAALSASLAIVILCSATSWPGAQIDQRA
jgi:hypothetical protein